MSCCSIGPFKGLEEKFEPWKINAVTAFSCSVIGNVCALLAGLIARVIACIQSFRFNRTSDEAKKHKLGESVTFWKNGSNVLLLASVPVIGGALGMHCHIDQNKPRRAFRETETQTSK